MRAFAASIWIAAVSASCWATFASAQDSGESQICTIYFRKDDRPLPSERITARCKPGDILTLIVPYGDEFALGGAMYCDFNASMVLIDDPNQRVKKQVCRLGKIRRERNPPP
jgi:hypothetical protein